MAGKLIVQHAEQPLAQIREWVTKRLKHLMGFDDVDGVVDYLMSLQSAEETEKYVKDILGTDRKAVLKFKDDLIQKRKDASPLFRTVAIRKPTAGPQSGLDPSANMKVYRKKETEADPFLVKKKKKPAKPKEQVQTGPEQQAQGKKKGKGGGKQAPNAFQAPGRTWCGCMGNCLWCGKIVCAQEGMGPCLFCGNPVGEAPGAGGSSLSKQEADAYDASLARALEHKDKLLEYERASARRTVIYDDQQDYFHTDGSQWLTPEQRKQLKKLEEEREKQRKEARSKVSISFDFAGRRIMVDEGEEDKDAFFFAKADEISRGGVLQNPTLKRPAPVFTAVEEREKEDKQDTKAGKASTTKGSYKSKLASTDTAAKDKQKNEEDYNQKLLQKISKRVQHDYYAVDSEWTLEESPVSKSSSSSTPSPLASHLSFKLRGLCERAFDYSRLYPSATFHQWTLADRREMITALKSANGGLTSYLYVNDATALSGLTASKDSELDRAVEIAQVCTKESVDFIFGLSFPASFFTETQEKDKLREKLDKMKIVDRIAGLIGRDVGCSRFAFFFDDSPAPYLPSTTSPSALLSGGKTSLLSSLHSYVANHLFDETTKRIKQSQRGNLEFYLLPLFYGKAIKEARNATSKQGPSFGVHQKEQEPEMDRDVVNYWKEIDHNSRSDFIFIFSGFTPTDSRASDRANSGSPSQHPANRTAVSPFAKLKQLIRQQRKVLLLDTYPTLIPTFKATATATAFLPASTASIFTSFPAITHLQGYESTKYAGAAEWAEGMALQVAPALLPPHAALIPLMTAFDFLLSPNTHDPSIALKSALLRLLQGEERLADELLSLIDASPAPLSSSSLAIRKFKMKKLATPTFFQETSDRLSYVRKGLAALPLGTELRPLFVLLDAFLEMNAIGFELESFFEKQKQKEDTAASGKNWTELNEIKKRLTEAERTVDLLLSSPAYPLTALKENMRELNTAYLLG